MYSRKLHRHIASLSITHTALAMLLSQHETCGSRRNTAFFLMSNYECHYYDTSALASVSHIVKCQRVNRTRRTNIRHVQRPSERTDAWFVIVWPVTFFPAAYDTTNYRKLTRFRHLSLLFLPTHSMNNAGSTSCGSSHMTFGLHVATFGSSHMTFGLLLFGQGVGRRISPNHLFEPVQEFGTHAAGKLCDETQCRGDGKHEVVRQHNVEVTEPLQLAEVAQQVKVRQPCHARCSKWLATINITISAVQSNLILPTK